MMMLSPSHFHLPVSALKVGDTVCTVGYIMDYFCIKRGTLFDNPDVPTLGRDGPIVHSVHCLIDVPSCVDSPFELLQDVSPEGETNVQYGRAFRAESNDLLVEYAKKVGSCQAGCSGSQERGLEAAVVGEIVNLGNSMTPATIKVKSVLTTAVGCPKEDSGNGTMTVIDTTEDIPTMILTTGSGSFNKIVIIHGTLMIIGWGFLIPTGAIIAKFLKHRSAWFNTHRGIQALGLILALISFIIILKNSNALGDKGSGSLNYPHAVMGVITMSIGLFQPLNAILRPHLPENEESKSQKRILWEYFHKALGWGAIILAVITIGMGTTLLPTKTMQKIFQICYGALVGSLLVLLFIFVVRDKKKYYDELSRNEKDVDDEA